MFLFFLQSTLCLKTREPTKMAKVLEKSEDNGSCSKVKGVKVLVIG